MVKGKSQKKDPMVILTELVEAGCNVNVTLQHKEEGSIISGKKLDSFLKNKDNLLRVWHVVSLTVTLPVVTEMEEANNAAETVQHDSSVD